MSTDLQRQSPYFYDSPHLLIESGAFCRQLILLTQLATLDPFARVEPDHQDHRLA
jgi:hypothetical protein